MVLCDMIVVATGPVASVGVNSWNQFCITDVRASMPTSVAQVTNHRTISRRRQFKEASVMRITCNPSSKATVNNGGCLGPFSGVAKRNASCANLNRCDELCMCRCADVSTVLSRSSSPLAALSIVDASVHCCVSMWPRVNHRGYRFNITEEGLPFGLSESSWSSKIGNLHTNIIPDVGG